MNEEMYYLFVQKCPGFHDKAYIYLYHMIEDSSQNLQLQTLLYTRQFQPAHPSYKFHF